jgi:ketosteroid isomerase-like protein
MGPSEQAVRRCVELFNKGTLEWVDTCYSKNADWVELPTPTFPQGRRGDRAFLRETAQRVLQLFPDRRMNIRRAAARDENVLLELDWTGTAASSFRDLKAGMRIELRIISFFEVRDGLIVKHTDYCLSPSSE